MDDINNSTALVPLESGALVPLDDIEAAARAYAEKSKASTTRAAYAFWWSRFQTWCERRGVESLPAPMAAIVGWVTEIAKHGTGPRVVKRGRKDQKREVVLDGKPLSRSSISQAIAAIQSYHRDAGYELNRKDKALAQVLKGINRDKVEIDRQAEPLMAADLLKWLGTLNLALNWACRDRCLLTLGWAAALRRSELTGLDFEQLGDGTGFVRVDELGIKVTLVRSKVSQDKPETVVIPRSEVPEACEALAAWVERAQIEPGQPLFRPVSNGHTIGDRRLLAASVSRIVKRAYEDIAMANGRTQKEARDLAKKYSGHSLRAGFVTSAAQRNVPALKIGGHTRHKSLEMVLRYCREADKYNNSALTGVLHAKTEEAA
jgi:integrase